MTTTIEQALADARGDAAVFRRRGDARAAELMETLCDQIAGALEDYLRWLSEEEAMLKSAHRRPWFRSRRAEWLASGNAKQTGRRWYYRAMVVPQRGNVSHAYEQGLREGEVA